MGKTTDPWYGIVIIASLLKHFDYSYSRQKVLLGYVI